MKNQLIQWILVSSVAFASSFALAENGSEISKQSAKAQNGSVLSSMGTAKKPNDDEAVKICTKFKASHPSDLETLEDCVKRIQRL